MLKTNKKANDNHYFFLQLGLPRIANFIMVIGLDIKFI